MSRSSTPEFLSLEHYEDTLPYFDFIPTRFTLFMYFYIDFNISLCYFDQYLKFPDESILFWVTTLENTTHKVIFEKNSPSYTDVISFIELTTEEFLHGEFELLNIN